MRTIGMLLGIPEEDQEAIRDFANEQMRTEEGKPMKAASEGMVSGAGNETTRLIGWAGKVLAEPRPPPLRPGRRRFRHPARTTTASGVQRRHPLLPGFGAGAAGGSHRTRGDPEEVPGVGGRYVAGAPVADLDGARLGKSARPHLNRLSRRRIAKIRPAPRDRAGGEFDSWMQ